MTALHRAWGRTRWLAVLAATGVLLTFQVVFDVFSNFVGGGMTLFGDVIFGGIILFIAVKAGDRPLAPMQAVVVGVIASLLAVQFWLDWRHSTNAGAWIVMADIATGAAILFLVYQLPRFSRLARGKGAA